MLPKAFSPTGDYSPVQLDKTRGYRLLVHAEIEAFLEDRATELATRAFNSWRIDFKPRNTIAALLAFCRVQDKSYGTLAESVGAAFGAFNNMIKHNHGIKEENVMKFLLAIGVERTQLDPTWLSTLDSFGTARGEVAHSSVRVQQPIDRMRQSNYRLTEAAVEANGPGPPTLLA